MNWSDGHGRSRHPPLGRWHQRCVCARIGRHPAKKGLDATQEVLEGLTAVIASDIGVQLAPQALDTVVLGRIRGQKVQDDPAVELFGQGVPHQATGMDPVIVEDDVPLGRVGKRGHEAAHQLQERWLFLRPLPTQNTSPVRVCSAPAR